VAETGTQRVYRAACPGCGAPVEFRSAASTHAVCSYCQSTVVRDGETLSRIGKMAELFDDHSPLQLMAAGRWNQRAFTLVGRLQYRSGSGTWTEWIALFDDGTTGVLAEDNGAYVFAQRADVLRELPGASHLRVGANTSIDGRAYQVAGNDAVTLIAAQGELPKLPPLNAPFAMVELRSADGEVLSIDYGAQPPQVSRGRAVRLDELQLAGLRDDSTKETQGRQFACPNCGAQVQVQFGTSKSVTCRACNSLIDLAAGLGGELHHAAQSEPVQPLIPLGTTGQLQGVDWQVVGYQHRLGHDPEDPDEHFGWDEYLLYNRKRGFIFLVDTTEGWSVVKPTTGAPSYSAGAQSAHYLGTTYQLQYSYRAETTYVAGEFYWPVERGHKTFNRDFARGKSLLSLEETPRERTWSSGSRIDSDLVAKAFKLENKKDLLKRGDAGPTSGGKVAGGLGCGTLFFIIALVIVIALIAGLADDDNNSSSGYRSSGGSWGGYSSGGSHK
jgi:ribosomal protein S27E